jgi:hypothetical protein
MGMPYCGLAWRWPDGVLCWPRLAMNWGVPGLGWLLARRGLEMGQSRNGFVLGSTWAGLYLGFPIACWPRAGRGCAGHVLFCA